MRCVRLLAQIVPMQWIKSSKKWTPFLVLLHPFWNHWLFLQSDWLSEVRFIPKSHYFCSKSHLFLSQWDLKDLEVFFKLTNYIAGKFKTKRPLFGTFGNFCFSCSSLKWMQLESGNWTSGRAILVWNHTCDHAYDFWPNCTPLSAITIIYYIHFEITGYPYNLIGAQLCDLFPNRTIFCSKLHLFLSQWDWDSKTKQPIRFQGFF